MMHSVHAPIATPVPPLGFDAAHAAPGACDVPGDSAGTVWYTVVDFIRAVVDARASTRPAPSPGTAGAGRGEGVARTARRPTHH